MNNNFDFSYFIPTPDTTANCALSRWNDGLIGLSDFIKAYMSSRQSLEFGFSRSLNISELLNLGKNSDITDPDGKYDYVLNFNKYGDLKAHICGFEVPLLNKENNYLSINYAKGELNAINDNTYPRDFTLRNEDGFCITYVFNHNDDGTGSDLLNVSGRKAALRQSIEEFINDVTETSENTIEANFRLTKTDLINNLNNILLLTDDNSGEYYKDYADNLIFNFRNKKDCKDYFFDTNTQEKRGIYLSNLDNNGILLENTNSVLFEQCLFKCFGGVTNRSLGDIKPPADLPIFKIDLKNINYFINKYCHKNGIDIEISYGNTYPILWEYIENGHPFYKKNILIRFLFNLTEYPELVPFVSHDGTEVPLSKQNVTILSSLSGFKDQNFELYWDVIVPGDEEKVISFGVNSDWDNINECPAYFDVDGNPQPMTLEENINGMGGRDYTIWSSPVQKTENGYQFECVMPLAFYNEETDSYSNEYYAKSDHLERGIVAGQVMYRVPVVKRMQQNIEEAIVNTHMMKCLENLEPATNENANNDDTVVLGGVVVDDFTEGLYSVADEQKFASDSDYGEVKITKATPDNLTAMYDYSENGPSQDYTVPQSGRAIDMYSLFDVLKVLSNGQSISEMTPFVVRGNNSCSSDDYILDVYKIGKQNEHSLHEFKSGIKIIRGDENSNGYGMTSSCLYSDDLRIFSAEDEPEFLHGINLNINSESAKLSAERIKYDSNLEIEYHCKASINFEDNFDSSDQYRYFKFYPYSEILGNPVTPVYIKSCLGRNNDEWDYIYVNNIASSNSITLSTSINPQNNTIALGTNDNKFKELYATNLYGNLNGLIPTPTYNDTSYKIVPTIGTIMFLEINIAIDTTSMQPTDELYILKESFKHTIYAGESRTVPFDPDNISITINQLCLSYSDTALELQNSSSYKKSLTSNKYTFLFLASSEPTSYAISGSVDGYKLNCFVIITAIEQLPTT